MKEKDELARERRKRKSKEKKIWKERGREFMLPWLKMKTGIEKYWTLLMRQSGPVALDKGQLHHRIMRRILCRKDFCTKFHFIPSFVIELYHSWHLLV